MDVDFVMIKKQLKNTNIGVLFPTLSRMTDSFLKA